MLVGGEIMSVGRYYSGSYTEHACVEVTLYIHRCTNPTSHCDGVSGGFHNMQQLSFVEKNSIKWRNLLWVSLHFQILNSL